MSHPISYFTLTEWSSNYLLVILAQIGRSGRLLPEVGHHPGRRANSRCNALCADVSAAGQLVGDPRKDFLLARKERPTARTHPIVKAAIHRLIAEKVADRPSAKLCRTCCTHCAHCLLPYPAFMLLSGVVHRAVITNRACALGSIPRPQTHILLDRPSFRFLDVCLNVLQRLVGWLFGLVKIDWREIQEYQKEIGSCHSQSPVIDCTKSEQWSAPQILRPEPPGVKAVRPTDPTKKNGRR